MSFEQRGDVVQRVEVVLVIVREEGRYDPVPGVAQLRHALVYEPPVRLDGEVERAGFRQRGRVAPQLCAPFAVGFGW